MHSTESLSPVETALNRREHELLRRGVESFNRGEFFRGHEEFEDIWKDQKGERRRLLQGLIQLCGALLHEQRDNRASALSLLKKAEKNISENLGTPLGLEIILLLHQIKALQQELALPSILGPPFYKINSIKIV